MKLHDCDVYVALSKPSRKQHRGRMSQAASLTSKGEESHMCPPPPIPVRNGPLLHSPPLTADKHLPEALFDNISLSTEGCHLTGGLSCLVFVTDNYTCADNMWTHFQCLSVASVPPLSFHPPFASHFHCIRRLTERRQCRGSQKNADKVSFFLLHL